MAVKDGDGYAVKREHRDGVETYVREQQRLQIIMIVSVLIVFGLLGLLTWYKAKRDEPVKQGYCATEKRAANPHGHCDKWSSVDRDTRPVIERLRKSGRSE